MKRYQENRHALGSEAYLTLVLEDGANPKPIFKQLWAQIEFFEERFSRFRPTSELTSFNQQAGQKTTVSEQFLELLKTCGDLSRLTNGLFTPFVLPALNKAGYVGSWPSPQKALQGLDYQDRKLITDINELEIGKSWARIPSNSALDFGGIGKGYLLDELSKTLDKSQHDNYWLSLGGDIICRGFDLEQQPWTVGIQAADDEHQTAGTITSNGGGKLAIATSGITKRKGTAAGKQWHHIIDPRTAQPAKTDIVTATLSAKDAVLADVAAKCLVIVGSKQAKLLSKQLGTNNLYLQLSNGKIIK